MKLKVSSTLILMFALALAAIGQTPTPLVNGNTDPSGIPDETAYRQIFVWMQAPTTATLAQKTALIGFTSNADVTTFDTNMASFASSYPTSSQSVQSPIAPPDVDALVIATMASLESQLTVDGEEQLESFVVAQKTNMNIYSGLATGFTDDNAGGGEATTFVASYGIHTGTLDSEYEFYGDMEGSIDEWCAIYPQTTVIGYGEEDGTGKSNPSLLAANGVTSPAGPSGAPGTGIIADWGYYVSTDNGGHGLRRNPADC